MENQQHKTFITTAIIAIPAVMLLAMAITMAKPVTKTDEYGNPEKYVPFSNNFTPTVGPN